MIFGSIHSCIESEGMNAYGKAEEAKEERRWDWSEEAKEESRWDSLKKQKKRGDEILKWWEYQHNYIEGGDQLSFSFPISTIISFVWNCNYN